MPIETKGARTRDAIVERAAEIFNLNGYAGTSISDILAATGLEKGGLYNHFVSKDELALAAFDRAVESLRERHLRARSGAVGARATLEASLVTFASLGSQGIPKGGCPLLNTAIETTDGHPLLRKRVRAAFTALLDDFERTLARGIASGELRAGTDAAVTASLLVCALEGAVMLSRLYRDPIHMTRVIAHLRDVLDSLVSKGPTT